MRFPPAFSKWEPRPAGPIAEQALAIFSSTWQSSFLIGWYIASNWFLPMASSRALTGLNSSFEVIMLFFRNLTYVFTAI
jgi:hypothetical protein